MVLAERPALTLEKDILNLDKVSPASEATSPLFPLENFRDFFYSLNKQAPEETFPITFICPQPVTETKGDYSHTVFNVDRKGPPAQVPVFQFEHQDPQNIWRGTEPPSPRPSLTERMGKTAEQMVSGISNRLAGSVRNLGQEFWAEDRRLWIANWVRENVKEGIKNEAARQHVYITAEQAYEESRRNLREIVPRPGTREAALGLFTVALLLGLSRPDVASGSSNVKGGVTSLRAQALPVIIDIPRGAMEANLETGMVTNCNPSKLAAGLVGVNNSGQIDTYGLVEGKPMAEFRTYSGDDVLLVTNGQVMAGYIRTPDGFISILSGSEPGTCRIQPVSASGVLPDIHLPGPVHNQDNKTSSQTLSQTDTFIDVAVFYTHELEQSLGNGNIARAAMLLQIVDAQDVIDASGINGVTLRPVFVGVSEISEGMPLDWYVAGAAFDNSSQTRTAVTTWSTDAKTLGVQDDSNGFCGLATVRFEAAPSGPNEIGFSMVNVGNPGCTINGRVASHELEAHELNGIMHNLPEVGGMTAIFPWAYGYTIDTRDQVPVGMPGVTTVPGRPCQQVPCDRDKTFSSPLLFDEFGRAQGDAATGDGVRVINELASSTANIQPSVVADSAFAVRVNTFYGGNLTPGIWVSTNVAPDVQSSRIEDTTEVAAHVWTTGDITVDFLADGKSCHVSTTVTPAQTEVSVNLNPETNCVETGGPGDYFVYLPLIQAMSDPNASVFGYPLQPEVVPINLQLPLAPWYYDRK